jgi:hypothetical protein
MIFRLFAHKSTYLFVFTADARVADVPETRPVPVPRREKVRQAYRTRGVSAVQSEPHQAAVELRRANYLSLDVHGTASNGSQEEDVQLGELLRVVESTAAAGGQRDSAGNDQCSFDHLVIHFPFIFTCFSATMKATAPGRLSYGAASHSIVSSSATTTPPRRFSSPFSDSKRW